MRLSSSSEPAEGKTNPTERLAQAGGTWKTPLEKETET